MDADGRLTLDYGPRSFTIGFDEQLKPTISDENGKPRKSLPKPGVKDDPDLASTAYKRFAELKKDVREVASVQVARLESSMVQGRGWTAAEFGEFVVRHPLMWHLARRLVWLSDGDQAFRLAEDRTCADLNDESVKLPQPFPQLGRPVLTLADGEGKDGRLERFEGLTVPTGKLLGLTRTSWRRGAPQDNGIEHWITWELAPDAPVVVDLSPGIAVGYVELNPEQTIERVRAENSFDDIDPVLVSELLTDLTSLTAP
ncbi:DUF4132 domain-containing protein [Actinomadura sp. BRA 177]|uniref:DUF4132 domain-containing protein n=1 Tax=Actinomadura sp. BRA 177 TaxID=2745202 RepID=UPI0015962635|nr:DUF4132 domain-containing protein [Actinomadura sp. BRA 177]NVI90402.1 DUF4132 domain-containing protein [Actinomadura sp. BRA 177]